MSAAAAAPVGAPVQERSARTPHPIRSLIIRRLLLGLLTLVFIAVVVYAATLVLPGDAANAILGQNATPDGVAALRHELGLDQPVLQRFFDWLGNAVHGDFGNSLGLGKSVTSLAGERIVNSAVLVLVTGIVSTVMGVVLGMIAARRRDGIFDTTVSVGALAASALPEFVVAIFVVMVFAVNVFQWFPAISVLPPGVLITEQPEKLVLPVLALVIVVTPYVFRMTRGALIEVLDSDYVELATLKGVPSRRLALKHALPNALAPIIQVVGLNFLYLAGGIVLVEAIFSYPGLGLMLVNAISGRDVPVIQFVVMFLAVFYILLNIVTDVAVLWVTPRKRYPR